MVSNFIGHHFLSKDFGKLLAHITLNIIGVK